MLAPLGVGTRVLVDPDRAERNNVNRILNTFGGDAERKARMRGNAADEPDARGPTQPAAGRAPGRKRIAPFPRVARGRVSEPLLLNTRQCPVVPVRRNLRHASEARDTSGPRNSATHRARVLGD